MTTHDPTTPPLRGRAKNEAAEARSGAAARYGGLVRIEQRHAASEDDRLRQWPSHMLTPVEAVRLVAMLASGSLAPGVDEAPVDAEDLLAALALVPTVRAEVEAAELALLKIARGHGLTWATVAESLGLGSAQAAQQRHERLEARAEDPPA